MKISIITCTYNRKDKVIKNILSVLNQQHNNVEHFIIDDGSKDNTVEEIKKLNISYLKIINLEKNLGQPGALFYSDVFKLISGDIFFLLDSDDYLLPGALKTIEKDYNDYFEKNKNLVSINYSYEDNNSLINGYPIFKSKDIFQDNYPRNITNKGFKDYLSVRNKEYLKEMGKYFINPEEWYLSYYNICANNDFSEMFTNKNIYKMGFSNDTVTRGTNIEKYSKWSLHTRNIIYKKFQNIMGEKYKKFAIRSLFLNFLVNSGNNLEKINLILKEKKFFLLNPYLIIIFFISLFVPAKLVLKIKKFMKSKKKDR